MGLMKYLLRKKLDHLLLLSHFKHIDLGVHHTFKYGHQEYWKKNSPLLLKLVKLTFHSL